MLLLKNAVKMYMKLSKRNIKYLIVCFIVFISLYIFLNYKFNHNFSNTQSNFNSHLYDNHKNITTKSPSNQLSFIHNKISNDNKSSLRFERQEGSINVALVLCGPLLEQVLVNIKSLIFFAHSSIHLIIFIDDGNKKPLFKQLSTWPKIFLNKLSVEVHPISLPINNSTNEWRNLWRPCASQRLFFPTVLPHIDALVYVDADSLFLRPIDELWDLLKQMNQSQIAGLSPESEDYATGWYNRFARHPFFEPLGVNSGVMFMNLTRMRDFGWADLIEPIFHKYRLNIVWGDQDIINIIFHSHPDKLFIFGCNWNYRTDHCMYTSTCKFAEKEGVAVLHGSRKVFITDKEPVFKELFNVWNEFDLSQEPKKLLLENLETRLKKHRSSNCGKVAELFTRGLKQFLKS